MRLTLSKCECGAVVIDTDDGRTYNCKKKNLKKFIPPELLKTAKRSKIVFGSCDHCINHYGLDLCACGSGKSPEKCKEHCDCCGQPSQIFGGRERFVSKDSWLAM